MDGCEKENDRMRNKKKGIRDFGQNRKKYEEEKGERGWVMVLTCEDREGEMEGEDAGRIGVGEDVWHEKKTA